MEWGWAGLGYDSTWVGRLERGWAGVCLGRGQHMGG